MQLYRLIVIVKKEKKYLIENLTKTEVEKEFKEWSVLYTKETHFDPVPVLKIEKQGDSDE